MGPDARLPVFVVLVLLAPVGLAQAPGERPPAEVEDVTFEDPIEPAGEPTQTTMLVRVGCDGQETPGTVTRAELAPDPAPWANVIVSPTSLSWSHNGSECVDGELPLEGEVELAVSVVSDAPAFQTTTMPIEATVTKEPPTGEGRSYGPYTGNVTVTPAFKHLHTFRVEGGDREVASNETARLEGTLVNEGNGETRYELGVSGADPALEVSLAPQTLTLAPEETGTFAANASLMNPSVEERQRLLVDVVMQATPTHPEGQAVHTDTASVEVVFEPLTTDDQRSVGAAGLVGLLVALALAARRRTG